MDWKLEEGTFWLSEWFHDEIDMYHFFLHFFFSRFLELVYCDNKLCKSWLWMQLKILKSILFCSMVPVNVLYSCRATNVLFFCSHNRQLFGFCYPVWAIKISSTFVALQAYRIFVFFLYLNGYQFCYWYFSQLYPHLGMLIICIPFLHSQERVLAYYKFFCYCKIYRQIDIFSKTGFTYRWNYFIDKQFIKHKTDVTR